MNIEKALDDLVDKKLDDLVERRCAQALKYPADEMLLLSIMRTLAVESAAVAVRDIKGEFDEAFNAKVTHDFSNAN